MALKACVECKKEISTDADPCPLCGKKRPHEAALKDAVSGGQVFGALIAIGGAALWINFVFAPFDGVSGELVDKNMRDVERKVAEDAVREYEIAKRSGEPMDACVHAGFVAAAFLSVKDESGYQQWKSTEKSDCEAAGVPR